MARKVTFLTTSLALSTWILLSPIGVRGRTWNSTEVCNTNEEPVCLSTDPTHSWTVSLDCSKADEVTVLYSDYSGHPGSPVAGPVKYMSVFEIRLQCTDGNVEAEMREVNCSIRSFGGGTPTEGPYTFTNLSASGILPGWTCTVTGCFSIGSNNLYVHTPAKNFSLPQCTSSECTCIDPDTTGSTTTEILNTAIPTTSDVTTTAVGETTEALPTTIMPSVTATSSVIEAESKPMNSIPLPTVVNTDLDITEKYQEKDQFAKIFIPLTVILIMLIAMVFPAIMVIGWMKQRKDRKILLVIDKQNMVFDPTYTPAICIDKPDLSLSHRISVVSTGYLQYLEPMGFCEGYQMSSDPYCADLGPDITSPLSKPPFGSNVNSSNQEDIAMDTDDCSKEFPGNGGYILESRVANTDDAIDSSTDSTSELIQDYGDCPPLEYIHGNLRNPNDLCRINGVKLHEALQSSKQESISEDAMSILLSEDGPSKNVGFSLDQHYSSSGSDYVQSSVPNTPVLSKEYPDNTPTNNVPELDLELHEEQLDGYQPQPTNLGLGNHETAAYVESGQFSSQNTQNVQYGSHKVVKCDDLDFSDSYSLDGSVLTQSLHSAIATLPGTQEAYNPHHTHLSNMDGYVQNEQQPLVNTTDTQDNGQDAESVELNFDTECEIDSLELLHSKEELLDPPRSSLDENLDLCSQVDLPCTSPTASSSRGYVTFEDNTTTATTSEPFTREIALPVSEISPCKTEPNIMVHLDFDENKSSQHPIVLESGIEIGLSGTQKQWHCPSGSSGYVTNESCLTRTDRKGQYISYDFVPMTDELRKESSDCLSVKHEPTDVSESQNQTSIDIESQSNYMYYPSDVSSGYLSGSSVAGDTRTYISQLREIS